MTFKRREFLIWLDLMLFGTWWVYQYLPGQSPLLQLCVSERLSFWTLSQFWSHVRVLVCSPDPHVTLQLDHSLHGINTECKLLSNFTQTSSWRFNSEIFWAESTPKKHKGEFGQTGFKVPEMIKVPSPIVVVVVVVVEDFVVVFVVVVVVA